MAKYPLFEGEGTDLVFERVRLANRHETAQARIHCEELWELFELYADQDFRIRIRTNFHSCYWEMHLTTYFILKGADVLAPKPGPDIGIVWNGQKIWFECVCPTRGEEGRPDYIPPIDEGGEVYEVPNEKLVLRYLNSIHQKTLVQYPKWLGSGAVSAEDAYVVAINPALLQYDWADGRPQRILQAAYPVGAPFVRFKRETLEVSEVGYHTRLGIKKASGNEVTTVFDNPDYQALSGLLSSRVNVANNHPEYLGATFQLVPNPRATVLLPDHFRLDGTYFQFIESKEEYIITPVETAYTPSAKT